MASREYLNPGVALQLRGDVWWLDLYRRGKRVRQSLGVSSRSKAMAIGYAIAAELEGRAEQIEDDATVLEMLAVGHTKLLFPWQSVHVTELADRLKTGALTATDAQSMIREAVRAVVGKTALKVVNAETALTEYLAYQTGVKGNKKRHVRNVELILRQFLSKITIENVGEITPTDVEGYLASISALSPKTRKDRRGMLAAWFTWMKVVKKYITENPAEGIAAPKVSAQDVRYHTSEELTRIIKAAFGHEKEDLVLVAIYTGLRAGELFRLEGEDFDYEGRAIRVRGTKTGLNRSVPLMDEILPVLMHLPRKGKLFPFTASGCFMRSIGEVWKAAKLTGKTGLQIIRHSWVSHLLLAGVDPYKVARYAGHDYAVQQKHYAGIKLGDTPFPMNCALHGVGKRPPRRR